MRRIASASVALSALVTSFVAPASEASPPTPGPRGRLCSYEVINYVTGGPMVWDRNFWLHCHAQWDNNTHTGPVAPGGDVHGPSDPHDGDAEDDEVAIVSGLVVDDSPEDSQKYVCTSVSWPGVTGPNWLYWHRSDDGPDGLPGTADDEAGHWSPSNTKPCSAVTQVSADPVVDAINDVLVDHHDPVLCDRLRQKHFDNTETYGDRHPLHDGPNPGQRIYVDAEGDVFVEDGDGTMNNPADPDDWRDEMWWDCPVYVDWASIPPGSGADEADGVYDK